jgi:hypothetical protein
LAGQVIEEPKNDFTATAISTKNIWANDALFVTGLIAKKCSSASAALLCIKRCGPLASQESAGSFCISQPMWFSETEDYESESGVIIRTD